MLRMRGNCVFSEITINLCMVKPMHLLLFNKMLLPNTRPSSETLTLVKGHALNLRSVAQVESRYILKTSKRIQNTSEQESPTYTKRGKEIGCKTSRYRWQCLISLTGHLTHIRMATLVSSHQIHAGADPTSKFREGRFH